MAPMLTSKIASALYQSFEATADCYRKVFRVFQPQRPDGTKWPRLHQRKQGCRLEGTRRWLPGTDRHAVESEFRELLVRVAEQSKTTIDCEWVFTRDAYYLDLNDPLVSSFRDNYQAIVGAPLTLGPKPFVDDGNSFWSLGKVPAITHGPKAAGQHTLEEWVSIDDLVRVALIYAATAVTYCPGS